MTHRQALHSHFAFDPSLLSIFLVFPLSPLASLLYHLPLLILPVLSVLSLTTIRPLLRCLPVQHAEAPAEGDILTVSCYTANKSTFLNDELLLCKWPLTDTVSARQSPVDSRGCCHDSYHFHDCGDLREAMRREVTGGHVG